MARERFDIGSTERGERRIHAGIEGVSHVNSSGNIRRFPVEIKRYFGECIGDKPVEDVKGILRDSQEKSWESSEKLGGN